MGFEERFNAIAPWLEVIGSVGLGFVALAAIEWGWDLMKRQRGWAESTTNAAIAIVGELIQRSTFGLVVLVGLIAVEPFALFDIPVTPGTWLIAIVVADFTYYWEHRVEHKVRLFWAYHSVHHSSPEFNLTTAFRLAWAEGAFFWIFFVPMVILGFDPFQTVVALLVGVTYQTWIHTRKIGKLGFLDRFLNTPSTHRVHHGMNGRYLDKNFGGVFIVWDRLFGTYEAEREPVVFEITKPIASHNPIVVNFYEFFAIARDCWRAPVRQWLGYVFGPPGWQLRSIAQVQVHGTHT